MDRQQGNEKDQLQFKYTMTCRTGSVQSRLVIETLKVVLVKSRLS